MENRSDNITNKHLLQARLLMQTLNSWRFFLLFTFPPMAWALLLSPPGILRTMIAMMSGIVWFGCWRLWLDAQYFSLINEENNEQAGEVLCFIWQREKLLTLTLAGRRQGALKQCQRTLYWVAILWLGWLMLLLFY